MVKVVIYEDDPNFRNSLSQFIAASAGLQLVGAFGDCRSTAEHVRILQPDLALMDLDMPHVGGLEGMVAAKGADAALRVLILTHHDDDEKIFDAIVCGGADGYLLKNATPDKIREAISDVMAGGSAMSPFIAKRALELMRPQVKSPFLSFFKKERHAPADPLTEAERRALSWLAKGHSYKMVASELNISINTVKNHLKKVYQKMQVHSAPEAVAKAIREQMV